MREIKINVNEAGQRFDKYLMKYLNQAPASFTYKMLRKKNITLNGKKAGGNEILVTGDIVKLFMSDETIEKFSKEQKKVVSKGIDGVKELKDIIVYEDENVLFLNKKAGMLSQKAGAEDVSVNEYMLDYLLKTKSISNEQLKTFRPSICNRLDRNTSGLITCGKSMVGLQELSRLFKERGVDKYYIAIVKGAVTKEEYIKGYIKKDSKTNKVSIINELNTDDSEYEPIETMYKPLYSSAIKAADKKEYTYTVLRVKLLTGKTHQIRAHLSHIKHPIIGDFKYGDAVYNEFFRNNMGIKHQLLHSYELTFENVTGALSYLNNQTFMAKLPSVYKRLWNEAATL